MKLVLLNLIFFLPLYIYPQVGINTMNPQTALDVNGDIGLRGELNVGTSSDSDVSAGKAGQVLSSQGSSLPPKWINFQYETIQIGDHILTEIEVKDDRKGVVLTKDYNTTVTYGDPLNSDWTVLDGLTTDILIKKATNEVVYTFQTVVQSPFRNESLSTSNLSIDLLCGFFVGKKGDDLSTFKLTLVREYEVQGAFYPQIALTALASNLNLPIGELQIVLAFQRRGGSTQLTSLPLYVGQGLPSGNVSNNFMNKSILRTDIFLPKD